MNGTNENYHLQWYHFQSGEVLEMELNNTDETMLTDHILKWSRDSTLLKCILTTEVKE
jgi:hypothetical protein